MKNDALPQVLFCAVVAIVFALAAWEAWDFEGTSRYFPLFAAVAGLLLAVVAGIVSAKDISKREPASKEVRIEAAVPLSELDPKLMSPETGAGQRAGAQTTASGARSALDGAAWLGIWVGFVLLVMGLGYLVGSAVWLGIWFRLVHRWPLRRLVPVILTVVAALWASHIYANVNLPGGDGFLFSMLQ